MRVTYQVFSENTKGEVLNNFRFQTLELANDKCNQLALLADVRRTYVIEIKETESTQVDSFDTEFYIDLVKARSEMQLGARDQMPLDEYDSIVREVLVKLIRDDAPMWAIKNFMKWVNT